MPPDPLQLDYAPPDPRPRRKRRRLLWAAFAVIAVWLAAEHLPGLVTRGQSLWTQHRCATFDFPPDAVVFDSDHPADLLADPSNYVAIDDPSIWPITGAARREPPPWTALKLEMFGLQQFWPPAPGAPKAMVHALTNARGDRRLVAIILAPRPRRSTQWVTPGEPAGDVGLVSAVVRPGDWSNAPRWAGNGQFLPCFAGAKRLTVHAARLNPADPSRFSIAYEMDGHPGTIDGQLDDWAAVNLTVRDGPTKRE